MFYSHDSKLFHCRLSTGVSIDQRVLIVQFLQAVSMASRLCGKLTKFCCFCSHTDGDRLVATLGSRSSLKSFTRKKILDVDVHRACDTIQNPEAPMALRLQGNLLFVLGSQISCLLPYIDLSFHADMVLHGSILSNVVMFLRMHKPFVTKCEVYP